MSKSHYRNINIDGKIWRWKMGSTSISIRGPNKESFAPYISELTGYEDPEREAWKGNLHLTPSHIRSYILKVLGAFDAIPSFKDIFNKKVNGGAYFSGGSLYINIDNESLCYSVGDGKNEDEKCWIALNYIKYAQDGPLYNTALEIVSKNPKYKKQLTLALLKASKKEYN